MSNTCKYASNYIITGLIGKFGCVIVIYKTFINNYIGNLK